MEEPSEDQRDQTTERKQTVAPQTTDYISCSAPVLITSPSEALLFPSKPFSSTIIINGQERGQMWESVAVRSFKQILFSSPAVLICTFRRFVPKSKVLSDLPSSLVRSFFHQRSHFFLGGSKARKWKKSPSEQLKGSVERIEEEPEPVPPHPPVVIDHQRLLVNIFLRRPRSHCKGHFESYVSKLRAHMQVSWLLFRKRKE